MNIFYKGFFYFFPINLIRKSRVYKPITYNNFSFADPSQMNTNKTTIANTWQNLKDDNYIVEFSPRSIRSKMYIKLKINFIDYQIID